MVPGGAQAFCGCTFGAGCSSSALVPRGGGLLEPFAVSAMMVRSYSNAGAMVPGALGAPEPPPKFTEGIPDVAAIERQKAAYNKSLDDQLQQGIQVLSQQNKQRKGYLNQVADQQKNQFNLQVDQQLRAQEMALDQQYNHQLMTLQQAAHEQKSVLEAQANTLALEYQQKKAQEDFNFQQYDIQRQHYEAQSKLNHELGKLQQ